MAAMASAVHVTAATSVDKLSQPVRTSMRVRFLRTARRTISGTTCCPAVPPNGAARRISPPARSSRSITSQPADRRCAALSLLSTRSNGIGSPSRGGDDGEGRPLSSAATRTGTRRDDDLLYSRPASGRTFPRTLLAMTSLHTTYWLWYVLDFTPAINEAARSSEANAAAAVAAAASGAAAQTFAEVDPTIGYVGLGLAILMSVGSAAYPRHLISEVRTGSSRGALRIKTHDLPLVTPERGEGTDYPLGSVIIDSTAEAEEIMGRHGGDIGKFRGHLGLRAAGSRGNLLLNIRGGGDVKRGDLLLNTLLPAGMGSVPVQSTGKDVDFEGPEGGSGRRRRNDGGRKTRREQRLLQRRRQQSAR